MSAGPHPELINTLAALALVSIASLVGSINFLLGKWLQAALPFLLSAATGALLGTAMFHLIPEAFEHASSASEVGLWLAVGLILSFGADRLLGIVFARSQQEHPAQLASALETAVQTKPSEHRHPVAAGLPLNILLGGAIHSLVDGVGIAAAFATGHSAGLATTLAVLLHEVPHHIADIGVLIYSGMAKGRAIGLNLLATTGCAVGGVLVLVFGTSAAVLKSILLPVTAANFLYIAVGILMPELQSEQGRRRATLQWAVLVAAVAGMWVLRAGD